MVIYPTVVQGKPANIFHGPGLLSNHVRAYGSVFRLHHLVRSCLGLMQLPRLNHPLFASKQFARATDDGFFISIEARDPKFSAEGTKALLDEIGGANIELVEDEN